MSTHLEGAAAGGIFNAIGAGVQRKRVSPAANMQLFEGKFRDEALRLADTREPRCPDLH